MKRPRALPSASLVADQAAQTSLLASAAATRARRVLVQNPYSMDSATRDAAAAWLQPLPASALRTFVSRCEPLVASKWLWAWLHAQALAAPRQADWSTCEFAWPDELDAALLAPLRAGSVRTLTRLGLALTRFYSAIERFRGASEHAEGLRRRVWSLCFGADLAHTARAKKTLRELSVLLLGERGAGKALLASALAAGCLRTGRYEVVHCAALSAERVESELFGVHGEDCSCALRTCTGRSEAMRGGSLLFDEVADLSLGAQYKIERALAEGASRLGAKGDARFDVRLLSTSSRDLSGMVERGEFHDDLLHRLANDTVQIAPLRERPEDIVAIGEAALERLVRRAEVDGDMAEIHCTPIAMPRAHKPSIAWTARDIRDDILEWLHGAAKSLPWPGNARQLEAAVKKHWATGAPFGLLSAEELPDEAGTISVRIELPIALADATATLEEAAQWYRERVLRKAGGNLSRAARILDTDRATERKHRDRMLERR